TAAGGTPTPTAVRTAASTATSGTTPIITPSPDTTQTSTPAPGTTQTSTPTPGSTQMSTPTSGVTSQGTPSPQPRVELPRLTAFTPELHSRSSLADGWPMTWRPTLQHAPSGRTSGLWCATVGSQIVNFDGTSWTQQPGDAISVAAGADGAVFAVGNSNQQQL